MLTGRSGGSPSEVTIHRSAVVKVVSPEDVPSTWVISPDRPVITTVLYGTGGSPPASVTQTVCDDGVGNESFREGVGATYDITVPQLSSRNLMLFACLGDITIPSILNAGVSIGTRNTIGGALAAAAAIFNSNMLTGDLLSGLSDAQLAECSNCDFPEPLSTVTAVPTLSEWGLIAMAGIIGIVGFMVMRRRKVTT